MKNAKMIIFTLDRIGAPADQQRIKDVFIELWRQGIVTRPGMGYYAGQKEQSFMCGVTTEHQAMIIRSICSLHKQDCYLEVEQETLIGHYKFLDNRPDELVGRWQETDINDDSPRTIDLISKKAYKCGKDVLPTVQPTET